METVYLLDRMSYNQGRKSALYDVQPSEGGNLMELGHMTIISSDKPCSKCKKPFPRTREYFDARPSAPDGLRAECKACRRTYMRDYRNRPAVQETDQAYRDAHKSESNERSRLQRIKQQAENPDYNHEHYERYGKTAKRKAYMKSYSQKYNQRASVKANARTRSERRRMIPSVRIQEMEYRRSPQGIASQKARKQRRRARMKNAPGQFTAADVLLQFKSQKGKCWWCGCELGNDYHADHLTPLARGGSNHPENIVVSCPKCNISRQDKMPWEWSDKLL